MRYQVRDFRPAEAPGGPGAGISYSGTGFLKSMESPALSDILRQNRHPFLTRSPDRQSKYWASEEAGKWG